MKQVVKFRGIDYNSKCGDLVYCPNCKVTEVIPVGASVCPKCGEEVTWASDDEDVYEVELSSLNEKFDVVEVDAKLTDEELYND